MRYVDEPDSEGGCTDKPSTETPLFTNSRRLHVLLDGMRLELIGYSGWRQVLQITGSLCQGEQRMSTSSVEISGAGS